MRDILTKGAFFAAFCALSVLFSLSGIRASDNQSQNQKYGLLQIYPSEDRATDLDIIFVHGLHGDRMSTWVNSSQDSGWFSWLPQDLPSSRIFTYGYPAQSTEWTGGSRKTLEDHAEAFLRHLTLAQIGTSPEKKVLFICHSLGGILVKTLLTQMGARALSDSTIGVVFLGVPNRENQLASYFHIILNFLGIGRPTPIVKTLTESTIRLNGDFNSLNIPVLTMVEAGTVATFHVVNRKSAQMASSNEQIWVVDEDHISIAKPLTRKSDVYQATLNFILEYNNKDSYTLEKIKRELAEIKKFRVGEVRPLYEVAVKKLGETSLFFSQLVDGNIWIEVKERTENKHAFRIPYDQLCEMASKTFDAVASDDLNMWGNNGGSFSQYAHGIVSANLKMVQRGVRVRRLFIGSEAELGGILGNLISQGDAGIEVKVLLFESSRVDSYPEDSNIVDNRLIQEYPLNQKFKNENNNKRDVHILTNPKLVSERIRLFEYVWEHATPLASFRKKLSQSL